MFACPEWRLVFLHLAVWISVWVVGVEAIESLGIPEKKQWDKWEGEREVFWPLVAFTAWAQIIEGHGNLSDRWTMLPFSNPLWTGPSITGGEINSIHQLFVSLGPLMPPDIAQGGLINVCGFDLSPHAWHWIKTLLFTLSSTLVLPTACQPILLQFWSRWILMKGKVFAKGSEQSHKLEFAKWE